MALPYSFLDGGTFTLNATGGIVGVNVQCNGVPDRIIAKSLPVFVASANGTGWGAKSVACAIKWEWDKSMPQGTAFGILQSSDGTTLQLPALTSYRLPGTGNVSVDAISSYSTANPPTFASLTATAITGSAGTFVVSMSNTGTIAVGDSVRIVNPVGELQIGGNSFGVTAVTANTSITLGYMASSGITFAADATAAKIIKYIPGRYYPRERRIANITQGATPTVYFMQPNDFTPGENVYFRVPTKITTANNGWGMQEMNNVVGRVLTVTNSATVSSITIDVNTSGFSAFSWPTSAVAGAGISPAVCGPSSSGVVPYQGNPLIALQPPGTNLLDSFDNQNVNLIRFGTALFNVTSHVSTNSDVWEWEAYKMDTYTSFTI